MSLIEIRDVHKWYGEFHVLKGISERVEKGEVLVICGPSGSGKSSLIRCLNRLEPIQKGDILFEGTSIYAPEVDVNALRAEVGMPESSAASSPRPMDCTRCSKSRSGTSERNRMRER